MTLVSDVMPFTVTSINKVGKNVLKVGITFIEEVLNINLYL